MNGLTVRAIFAAGLLLTTVLSAAAEVSGGQAETPQASGLTEQMLSDPGIMALIAALQEDPEMLALLSDPALLGAVQAGDVTALLADPRVLRLLTNPKVKEIENRLR